MNLLEKLKDKQTWYSFLNHKLEKGALFFEEEKQLRDFIIYLTKRINRFQTRRNNSISSICRKLLLLFVYAEAHKLKKKQAPQRS